MLCFTSAYSNFIWIKPLYYRELAELHRSSAVLDTRAQEAALSAEMTVREELKMTIEKQQQQHKWEKDSLLMQV